MEYDPEEIIAQVLEQSSAYQTREDVIAAWNDPRPHFGGSGPHRYDDGVFFCSYCGRPRDHVDQGRDPLNPLKIIEDQDTLNRLLSQFHVHAYHAKKHLSRKIGEDETSVFYEMDGKVYQHEVLRHRITVYDRHEFLAETNSGAWIGYAKV